jgi:hypothetical protein
VKSQLLLCARTVECRFALIAEQNAAENHSAIIAMTTMLRIPALENLQKIIAQHLAMRTPRECGLNARSLFPKR